MNNEQSQTPQLSVVVAIVSDSTSHQSTATHLYGCLDALMQQKEATTVEILVPHHPQIRGIEEVKQRFPNVRFVPMPDLKTYTGKAGSREHHNELRARGLMLTRGDIVALLEDHGCVDPHWCARICQAHEDEFAAVGGAIENGVDRPLNWAVYFCDFGQYQNPLPKGESTFASDANVSYKRSALFATESVWRDTFHEINVNNALLARGEKLALTPEMVVYQNRTDLRLGAALSERYVWGRSFAATRSELAGGSKRWLYGLLAPILPLILLGRMAKNAIQKRRLAVTFLKVLPLTTILTISWALGEFVGYVTGKPVRQLDRYPDDLIASGRTELSPIDAQPTNRIIRKL